MVGSDADEEKRAPIARIDGEAKADVDVEPDTTARGSTAGGRGDAVTRDGIWVCPPDASGCGCASGGMDDRGVRTVVAFGKPGIADGIGVGLRKPGTGVNLRGTEGGGVTRLSPLGGATDLCIDAEGGSGVMRFSGGGIVDLRDDVGPADGGCGVKRFSDGIGNLREDAGSTDERAATMSSSTSSVSPPRCSEPGVCVEARRDEPRTELCGSGPSCGVFPIVTSCTLVELSQRVISSLHER